MYGTGVDQLERYPNEVPHLWAHNATKYVNGGTIFRLVTLQLGTIQYNTIFIQTKPANPIHIQQKEWSVADLRKDKDLQSSCKKVYCSGDLKKLSNSILMNSVPLSEKKCRTFIFNCHCSRIMRFFIMMSQICSRCWQCRIYIRNSWIFWRLRSEYFVLCQK